ncbi:MAG: hypothetical protein ACXVB1_10890 [Pseudobdellovibrionaceae bacterium]
MNFTKFFLGKTLALSAIISLTGSAWASELSEPQTELVVCGRVDKHISFCAPKRFHRIDHVVFQKALENTYCAQGYNYSWGYDSHYIWAKNDCVAEFLVYSYSY